MSSYSNQTFRDFHHPTLLPWQRRRIYTGARFERCRFENCWIYTSYDPQRRAIVRDITLVNCEVQAVGIERPILEEVVVDGLRTHALIQTWAAVFKHVTFRGKVGRIMTSSLIGIDAATGERPARFQKAFDAANAAYYATVDWALDIREGEFQELDLRGVPAHLVRRDPQTQVVVTREKATEERFWRTLDLSRTYGPTALEMFLYRTTAPAIVLVAPKRARDFTELLAGLQRLRDAGVADPD